MWCGGPTRGSADLSRWPVDRELVYAISDKAVTDGRIRSINEGQYFVMAVDAEWPLASYWLWCSLGNVSACRWDLDCCTSAETYSEIILLKLNCHAVDSHYAKKHGKKKTEDRGKVQ